MFNTSPLQLLMLITWSLVISGHLTTFLGIWIITNKTNTKDIRTITTQAAQYVKKGIAEDLSGLVGNTSNLLNALNEMVQTVKGSGIFLCILGSSQIGVAIWLLISVLR